MNLISDLPVIKYYITCLKNYRYENINKNNRKPYFTLLTKKIWFIFESAFFVWTIQFLLIYNL